MKHRKNELLLVILFCGFLLGMLVGFLCLPKTTFSELEKRYLAEAPVPSWAAVSSGKWGDDMETYMADHIPGRNFFVGLNAYFELLTGRQTEKDIWVQDGRLVEAPVEMDQAAVDRNLSAIRSFSQTVGQTVDFMLIPSAGWAGGGEKYADEEILSAIYAQARDGGLRTFDISEIFRGKPELFFRTDHHWNSEGAYRGYAAYMTAKGRAFQPEDEFEKKVCAQFQGSTFSRSALWLTPAEELVLWTGSDDLTAENAETGETHEGVYYWERLDEADKYTVFLDGNHSLVRVRNPKAEGKLLVIRDSYSNSLGCFLAESYGEVVLVDLRYFRKQGVSRLAAQEGFDDILVCYSIGNFLTDTNLVWLK